MTGPTLNYIISILISRRMSCKRSENPHRKIPEKYNDTIGKAINNCVTTSGGVNSAAMTNAAKKEWRQLSIKNCVFRILALTSTSISSGNSNMTPQTNVNTKNREIYDESVNPICIVFSPPYPPKNLSPNGMSTVYPKTIPHAKKIIANGKKVMT